MKNISEGTYMHCPHCEKKISFFSKALNSWGKFKICPHCQSDLEVSVNLKFVTLGVIPFICLYTLIISPLISYVGNFASLLLGLCTAMFIVFSLKLNKRG